MMIWIITYSPLSDIGNISNLTLRSADQTVPTCFWMPTESHLGTIGSARTDATLLLDGLWIVRMLPLARTGWRL